MVTSRSPIARISFGVAMSEPYPAATTPWLGLGWVVRAWEHVFHGDPGNGERGDDSARRPRLVLRLGRAARRAGAARPAGNRRHGRCAGGQLRGQGPRGPHRDGWAPGA